MRRLSDVKILPKSVAANAQGEQMTTDIYYDNQPQNNDHDNLIDSNSLKSSGQTTHISSPKALVKKVVDLDDGLVDEELNSVPYSSDIQYDKATKTLDAINSSENSSADNENPNNKAAGDAKTPLPKPKKPPKLPN